MANDPNVVSEFRAFVEEFESESDRAIVVLTAARLDYLLVSIFQKYLVPNPNKTDEFFENQGPGSSFSNKIMLAYRLGLIDRDFARALNLVRSIRNDFAHEASACSLERGSHRDRVGALAAPYRRLPFFAVFQRDFVKEVAPSRADYMTVVGFLIIRLHYLYSSLDAVDSARARSVVTQAMRELIEPELTAGAGGAQPKE